MDRQPELQTLLETVLGSRNVYFQPPDSLRMAYPAIVYVLDTVATEYADNTPYSLATRYQVTYIDRSPVSDVPGKIQLLPRCRFSSYFASDGLNHYNHTIYY